jgi:hypothetical protein
MKQRKEYLTFSEWAYAANYEGPQFDVEQAWLSGEDPIEWGLSKGYLPVSNDLLAFQRDLSKLLEAHENMCRSNTKALKEIFLQNYLEFMKNYCPK